MTVSKSIIPSGTSANLSIMSLRPHPPLHSQHLKNPSTVSTSVTKATVDTTSTAAATTGISTAGDASTIGASGVGPEHLEEGKGGETMAVRELAAAASSASQSSNGSSESGSPGAESKSSSKNPSSWDPQDDILLRHLKEIKKLGWKDISQYFNNRTPNACQFRWRRLRSGNLKTTKSSSGTDSILASGSALEDPHFSSAVTAATSTGAAEATAALNPYSQVKQEEDLSPAIPIPNGVSDNVNGGDGNFELDGAKNMNNSLVNFGHSLYSQSPLSGIQSVNSTPINNFENGTTTTANNDINNDNGAGSNHLRVRSHSHSFSKPFNTTNNNHHHSTNSVTVGNGSDNNGTGNGVSEDENVGFIPKIIVRSRRSSFVHPQSVPSATPLQQHHQQSLPQSFQQTPSHLSSAFNTTLNTSKSRKNSFTSRSRRSSFSVAGSTTPSRRSSIIMAPNSLSGMFGGQTGSSTPKLARRDSIVKKELYTHRSSSASASFMDLPPAAASIAPPTQRRLSRTHCKQSLSHQLQHHKFQQPSQQSSQNHLQQQHLQIQKHLSDGNGNPHNTSSHWSTDEDQLLSENTSRNLSLMELSILLPNRSEQEIQWRLDTMFGEKSPTVSNDNSQSPFTSPRKSITPEDTAIDEDTCDERDQVDDDDEMDNMSIEQIGEDESPPTFTSKEATPASIISSTTTKEDNLSDESSSRSRNRPENMANNGLEKNYHTPNGGSRFNESSSATATSLPSISAILKGTL